MKKKVMIMDVLDDSQKEEFIALGNNVKFLREEKGMTQDEFASAVGCSKSTISGLESKAYFPNGTYLFKMAKVLGKKIWELFSENHNDGSKENECVDIFPKRPRIHPSEKELDLIMEKYKNGIPDGAIEEMIDRYL